MDQIWIGAKGIVFNVPAHDGQPSLHQREAFIVAYEYSAIGRLYNLRIYLVDPLHALDMYSSEEEVAEYMSHNMQLWPVSAANSPTYTEVPAGQ